MSEENAQIYVKVFDEDTDKLRLILPGDGWTFEEAKIAKAVSEGMAPAEIEAGLLLSDPDAWMAVLRVSYLRANQQFPTQRIGQLNILGLAEAVQAAVREVVKRRPPTKANGNEPAEPEPQPQPTSHEVQS